MTRFLKSLHSGSFFTNPDPKIPKGVFVEKLRDLMQRMALPNPAKKVPSNQECRFCPLTVEDCPEWIDQLTVSVGKTDLF